MVSIKTIVALVAAVGVSALPTLPTSSNTTEATHHLEKRHGLFGLDCQAACGHGIRGMEDYNRRVCEVPCVDDMDDDCEWLNEKQLRQYIMIVDPETDYMSLKKEVVEYRVFHLHGFKGEPDIWHEYKIVAPPEGYTIGEVDREDGW